MKLSPYKFKLWLDRLEPGILNARQKHLLLWLLAWGKAGCDSWNWRLAKEMHCCIRTIRRDLRQLERYHFIDNRGALGKYRRLIAIPFPSMRAWKSYLYENVKANLAKKLCQGHSRDVTILVTTPTPRGDKFVPHQESLNKDYLNIAQKQRDLLLYGPRKDAEPAKTAATIETRGETPRTPPAVQGREAKISKMVRKQYIDRFLRMGWPRERAIRIADATLKLRICSRSENRVPKYPSDD